jgi:hypothetical protein
MPNALVFILFAALVGGAILVGRFTGTAPIATPALPATPAPAEAPLTRDEPPVSEHTGRDGVPSIGSIQVLNACGMDNAGAAVADFLRSRGFDVKDVGNASTWNYPATIVVSRTHDMRNAERVAEALRAERVILLREEGGLYDVAVFIGADFKENVR